ncbi:sensor histidine kinase [Phenylobacterium sp.]|uniref:sensor histidine kinase n=1 Tax=Phenylobacterium sp. TaxID=1871053 RepID=UPI00121AC266|nr:sensor histidine kinase [Phenylobacterium sp.]THD58856.1 MAG: sensor histidine kinase [Phenylobacterium sp.]
MTDPAQPNAVPHAFDGAAAKTRPVSAQDERRELDHRLANSLQLAADFLIFEHMRIADPQARAALMATADRLSAVGQMHRFLAAHRQASGVELEPFLVGLAELIGESTGLICDVEADPIEAPGEIAQQLAIVINELAMNAAKHAYPWGARGPLHIVCRRRNGGLVLTVADEGQGLSHGFAAERASRVSSGLGMTIVEAIVRQLNGLLEAVSDGGAKFTLTIPLPASGRSGPSAGASRSFAPPSELD